MPVDGEPLAEVGAYGSDRVFVRIALAGADDGGREALAAALEAAGHPVIRIGLADPIDLGAEFVALGGRDRDRRASSSASTRSTSPTWKRRSN